jgi:hypothetical protein
LFVKKNFLKKKKLKFKMVLEKKIKSLEKIYLNLNFYLIKKKDFLDVKFNFSYNCNLISKNTIEMLKSKFFERMKNKFGFIGCGKFHSFIYDNGKLKIKNLKKK